MPLLPGAQDVAVDTKGGACCRMACGEALGFRRPAAKPPSPLGVAKKETDERVTAKPWLISRVVGGNRRLRRPRFTPGPQTFEKSRSAIFLQAAAGA